MPWNKHPRPGARPVRIAVWSVVVIVSLLAASCSSGTGSAAGPVARSTTTEQHRVVVAPSSTTTVPASTVVAALHGTVARYATPGGTPDGTVPGTWYGSASILPVLAEESGYLEVRLAQRPNNSTAWIQQGSATLSSTPYRIVVDLGQRRLHLYDAGTEVMNAPAGIGTTRDPTPTGNFFVAFFAAPPSSGYGAFVIVTSGHSNAISDFEESGDAVVAIHGPLGADRAIGTTGAQVSHGCVRLHESDLVQLRQVPAGSPVDIVQ